MNKEKNVFRPVVYLFKVVEQHERMHMSQYEAKRDHVLCVYCIYARQKVKMLSVRPSIFIFEREVISKSSRWFMVVAIYSKNIYSFGAHYPT